MRRSSRTVLGLDPGQHAVKAVLATIAGGRLRVLKAEHIPIPPDLADPGAALRKWWEDQKLGALPVACSVSGSRVLYQPVRMEDEDPRTPEQVAGMEAMRFSEMTDARMQYTATPASALPGERRLLVSMARPDLLEACLSPAVHGGFRIVNACPAPIALYNGVTALGEPIHQPTLFADLGATHTEVVVGDGNGVLFARSFALGTAQLTQSVAAQARLPLQQAERVRVKALSFAELPGESGKACEQFVQRWLQEIRACMQMYLASLGPGNEDRAVKRILLAGGGARWEPLREALHAASPLPLSLVGRIAGHEQQESAEYIIAVGLAADALGIARAPSSLLAEGLRQVLARIRNKRHWMAASLFAVGGMLMIGAASHIASSREKARLSQQNLILQRCDTLRQGIETSEARMLQMETMTAPLVRYVNNSARIRDLTLIIGAARGPNDFVTFLGDSESYVELRMGTEEERERRSAVPRASLVRREPNRQQADRLRDDRMNRLIIEGFTPRQDLSTVKRLIETLRSRPGVLRADLLGDDLVYGDPDRDVEWISTGNRRFVIDVELEAVAEPSSTPPTPVPTRRGAR
jgi:Tfp pilus assembly PilM family ATPase